MCAAPSWLWTAVGRRRHLSKAPIQEALVDIQFASSSPLDVSAIASAFAAQQRDSVVVDIWESLFQLKLAPKSQPQSSASGGAVGKRVDFPSLKQVLQFRSAGFTFSRLPPYGTFEDMEKSMLAAWALVLARLSAPVLVTRATLRYINSLTLPPGSDFSHYLVAGPVVPPGLPQTVSGFLSRISIPCEDCSVNVTQAFTGVATDGASPNVLLDIEAAQPLALDADNTTELRAVLSKLRNFKNDVFFESLTELALEMYE